MARPARTRRGSPSRWMWGGAAGLAAVLVVGLAAVWPGYDAQQAPLDDGTIWALQRSAGGHYARVNAELLELDTVKQISQPTTLAQTTDAVWAFAASATRVAGIDPATPPDLDAGGADAFVATPAGTRSVSTSGTSVAYLTEAGSCAPGHRRRGGSVRRRRSRRRSPRHRRRVLGGFRRNGARGSRERQHPRR